MTTLAAVGGMIELIGKLADKFPDYKQKIEKDYNKVKKQYISYSNLPREKRVSSYLYNLKNEVQNHLLTAKDYIK